MSYLQRHVIGRIILEVETRDVAAWEIQEELSQLLQQQAGAAMEQLFDQCISRDEVVRLDQLVIDLPPLNPQRLSNEFVPQLIAALQQALADLPRQPFQSDGLVEAGTNLILAEPQSDRLTQTPAAADWEALLYFLEYGRLPWWQSSESLSIWVARWEAVMQQDGGWRTALQRLLTRHPLARQRLVEQLPESFRRLLILRMQPTWTEFQPLLEDINVLMQTLQLNSRIQHYLEQRAWLFLFAEIQSTSSTSTPFPVRQWLKTWLTEFVAVLNATSSWDQSPQRTADLRSSQTGAELSDSASISVSEPYRSLRNLIATAAISQSNLWFTAVDDLVTDDLVTQAVERQGWDPQRAEPQMVETETASSLTRLDQEIELETEFENFVESQEIENLNAETQESNILEASSETIATYNQEDVETPNTDTSNLEQTDIQTIAVRPENAQNELRFENNADFQEDATADSIPSEQYSTDSQTIAATLSDESSGLSQPASSDTSQAVEPNISVSEISAAVDQVSLVRRAAESDLSEAIALPSDSADSEIQPDSLNRLSPDDSAIADAAALPERPGLEPPEQRLTRSEPILPTDILPTDTDSSEATSFSEPILPPRPPAPLQSPALSPQSESSLAESVSQVATESALPAEATAELEQLSPSAESPAAENRLSSDEPPLTVELTAADEIAIAAPVEEPSADSAPGPFAQPPAAEESAVAAPPDSVFDFPEFTTVTTEISAEPPLRDFDVSGSSNDPAAVPLSADRTANPASLAPSSPDPTSSTSETSESTVTDNAATPVGTPGEDAALPDRSLLSQASASESPLDAIRPSLAADANAFLSLSAELTTSATLSDVSNDITAVDAPFSQPSTDAVDPPSESAASAARSSETNSVPPFSEQITASTDLPTANPVQPQRSEPGAVPSDATAFDLASSDNSPEPTESSDPPSPPNADPNPLRLEPDQQAPTRERSPLSSPLEPSLNRLPDPITNEEPDAPTSPISPTPPASPTTSIPDTTALPTSTEVTAELQLHPLMAKPPKQTLIPSLSRSERANGIYLNCAGLVLLHPFLPIYFEDVGLVRENQFRHEYAQQQAIGLLYYLATKETRVPEYELVLPKLLCDWPLDEPLIRDLELPEAALAEGENLLQAVINYWEVLQSTSPDGLREGFLQRQGNLTRTDNWKLRVEQQSIDILLSRLPWGLSMVKLPWMREILMVEWT